MNKEERYDIHCHLLPGVDDGAVSMEESLGAVKMAYQDGIRHLVFTPHYVPGETTNEKVQYQTLIEHIKQQLQAEGVNDIHFYTGNEILYSSDVPKLLEAGKICTIADSKYVLLEFLPGVHYQDMFQGLSRIVYCGFMPILAHVERYPCLYHRIDYIEELEELGVLLQMNTECFEHKLLNSHNSWFKRIMREGHIQLLATDAHDLKKRPPRLETAVTWIYKSCDERLVRRILYDNPAAVIAGRGL